MGQQVIKQPDGLYAIFDTGSGMIEVWNATRDEIIQEFMDAAATRAREQAERVLHAIDSGVPSAVYRQGTLTWEQAVQSDRESDGSFSTGRGE